MEHDEDYFSYGTPVQEEVETVTGQYAKEKKDPAVTRSLPVWQQEVTDEQGRRRFHGAFTGGYSAGFFNSVGSLEGFTPGAFKSSSLSKAAAKQQAAEDYMDEEELNERQQQSLQAHADYDTFGSTAAEMARKRAATEAAERGTALPSLVPTDLIAPVAESVGVKMLQSMGWRQGKGLGTRGAEDDSNHAGKGSRKWGQVAGIGIENTPIYALPPKTDAHGLGFDPFKGAEEFRRAKRGREVASQPVPAAKRTRGIAFGSGAGDEDDAYGMTEDYVTAGTGKEGMSFEIASDDDDEPVPRGGRLSSSYLLPSKAQPQALQSSQQHIQSSQRRSLISGFTPAEASLTLTHFSAPTVPRNFSGKHTFSDDATGRDRPSPKEIPPPEDEHLRRAINSLAPYVARLGPSSEKLVTVQLKSKPGYSFLGGGLGQDYYLWRVHQLRQGNVKGLAAQGAMSLALRSEPLSADDRAVLLGEQQLPTSSAATAAPQGPGPAQAAGGKAIAETDRQRLQAALASTFMPAQRQDNQAEHEQRGGLMPGAASRPQVEVQSAAAAAAAAMAARFAKEHETETATVNAKAGKPQRTTEEWRPEPLLCKRFNAPDPFKGRPQLLQAHTHFKFDALALPDTDAANVPTLAASNAPPAAVPQAAAPAALDAAELADEFLDSLSAPAQAPALSPGSDAPLPGPPASLPPPPDPDASAEDFIEMPEEVQDAFAELLAADLGQGDSSEEDSDREAAPGPGQPTAAATQQQPQRPASGSHASDIVPSFMQNLRKAALNKHAEGRAEQPVVGQSSYQEGAAAGGRAAQNGATEPLGDTDSVRRHPGAQQGLHLQSPEDNRKTSKTAKKEKGKASKHKHKHKHKSAKLKHSRQKGTQLKSKTRGHADTQSDASASTPS